MLAFEFEDASVGADHFAVLVEGLSGRSDDGAAEGVDDFGVVVDDEVRDDGGEEVESGAVLEDGFAHDAGEEWPEIVFVGDFAPGAVAGPHVDVVAAFLESLEDFAGVGSEVEVPGDEAAVDVEEDVEWSHGK